MVNLTSIQNKLASKIFDTTRIASSMLVENVSGSSMSKWGDTTWTYSAGVTASAVPFNYVTKERYYEPFGDLEDGEMDAIFPYNQNLTVDARITFNSDTYRLIRWEKFPMANGIIAQVVRMKRTN